MRKRWSREWTHFIRHWEERKTVDANEVNVYSVHDIRILKTRHKKRERLSTGSLNSHSFIRNEYFRHAMSFVLSLFLLGIINLYPYCQELFKLLLDGYCHVITTFLKYSEETIQYSFEVIIVYAAKLLFVYFLGFH